MEFLDIFVLTHLTRRVIIDGRRNNPRVIMGVWTHAYEDNYDIDIEDVAAR